MELVCSCGSPVPIVDDDARAVACPGCKKPVTVPEAPAAVQLSRVVDNPIVLRATFAKLRMPGAWVGIGIMAALCILILGGAFAITVANDRSLRHLPEAMTVAFWCLFVLQGIALFFGGTNSTATGIAQDRESGVFEMMKMTPRSNRQLLTGYVFGMPVREHLWALIAAPFAGVAAIFGRMAIHKLIVLYGVLYVCVLMYHCFGALIGVTMKNRRAVSGIAVGVPFLFHFFMGGYFTGFHLTPLPSCFWAAVEDLSSSRMPLFAPDVRFFGLPLPVPFFDAVIMVLIGSAFWFAAMRKLRSDETPAFSKGVALGYVALCQLIALGVCWDYVTGRLTSASSPMWRGVSGVLESGFLLFGSAFTMMLAAMGTPSGRLYARVVRRAMKQRATSVSPFSDGGLNPLYAGIIALITSLSAILLPADVAGKTAAGLVAFSSIYVMAVLLQWTKLKSAKSWALYFGASLFALWGVPIVLAVIAGIGEAGASAVVLMGGLFPGIGIVGAVAEPIPGFIIAGVNITLGLLVTSLVRSNARTYWVHDAKQA